MTNVCPGNCHNFISWVWRNQCSEVVCIFLIKDRSFRRCPLMSRYVKVLHSGQFSVMSGNHFVWGIVFLALIHLHFERLSWSLVHGDEISGSSGKEELRGTCCGISSPPGSVCDQKKGQGGWPLPRFPCFISSVPLSSLGGPGLGGTAIFLPPPADGRECQWEAPLCPHPPFTLWQWEGKVQSAERRTT